MTSQHQRCAGDQTNNTCLRERRKVADLVANNLRRLQIEHVQRRVAVDDEHETRRRGERQNCRHADRVLSRRERQYNNDM